ncbi:MAG: beta-ketoacyl-ACP synthase II [Candidatus Obscuribacterales bacterium]|nr:beta-ketoacyl-ACP synthase II [Cyanobacteria bacterium SZAS LIN-5]RTL42501.1 MAG: beta-ketoacyl-[acyl-carrier-protein] synthase II [Candidatus Melainabacteria bacterium]
MTKERVVVTGIGAVSAVGTGIEEFWKGIVQGRSGVKRVTTARVKEEMQSACKIAAEIVDFDASKYLEPKQVRRTDRFIQFAVAAAQLAVDDAKLDMKQEDPTRVGVVVGSAAGGFETIEQQYRVLMERGPDRCSPFTVPMLIVNMAAGWVSILHNAKGPNSCTVTACATSANSIGDAYMMIERGDADVMFAGGSEAPITALCMAGFSSARTLSTRNNEPERASRPFDKDRDGFVMGEGGAILILESLSHAQKRGAKILAELVGYGMTGDAWDIVQPCADGNGAARAMQAALKQAGMKPEDVNYINAHGTSTPLGDRAETTAIKSVFGEHATKHKLAVSSSKSMTGHLLGAAGALEAAVCIMAINDSILPPTINLDNPDPECDLDYVANVARKGVNIDVALSNSFGFGGHNACLLFKKFKS